MTFTVGGVDVTAVNVGATPAVAVYLGADKVWPTSAPTYRFRFQAGIYNADPGPGHSARGPDVYRIAKIDLDGQSVPQPQPGDIWEMYSETDGARVGFMELDMPGTDNGDDWSLQLHLMHRDDFTSGDGDVVALTAHPPVKETDWTWRWDARGGYITRDPGNAGYRESTDYILWDQYDRGGIDRTAEIAAWQPGQTLTMTGLITGDVLSVVLKSFNDSQPDHRWTTDFKAGNPPWPGKSGPRVGEPVRYEVS